MPNTNTSGIIMIILLAILKCNSKDKLTILSDLTFDDIEKAKKLKDKIIINISMKENVNPLFIETNVMTKNHNVKVIIEQFHDKIKTCYVDNKLIFDNNYNFINDNINSNLNFNDFFQFVVNREYDISTIENIKNTNYEVGKYGMEHDVGLNIGSIINSLNIYDNKIKKVISATVSGIDSRMSGVPKKVYINSGSGNQGLTATIPIVEFAKQYNISKERELDAIVLSHLVAIYIRSKQNKLSSSCGAICAAAGVSAGITYMLNCNRNLIESAIINVLCSNFGIFCDGAKVTCSLKVASAISSAINSSFLALKGVCFFDSYGIFSKNLEYTLETLGVIEKELTKNVDKIIMDEAIKIKKKEL